MLVPKPMKLRDVLAALTRHGCRIVEGKGSHRKAYCPCGEHMAVVAGHRDVAPGVIGDLLKKLTCLPEGWLQ